MIRQLRITVLSENTVRRGDLLAEHGLAFWIEADQHRILFDTGQGKVLQHNARQLGIDLKTAELVALSHGHFDHSGGLSDVLPGNGNGGSGKVALYLHPAALGPKFSRGDQPPHTAIGMPRFDEAALRKCTRSLTWTRTPTKLADGIFLTGEIPRKNAFEDAGGPFYRDADCTQPDLLPDDQALWIEIPSGTVILLGCAHSGVLNTLDYIFKLTDRRPIQAVLGGMHLVRAKPDRLATTVDAFRRYDIPTLGPAHCTGMAATAYLWSHLPGRCVDCSVGSTFMFG
jgi:7,8-dihydropterin-6-yl-methyl-4-(beta-D-ribofuranosyl)aminobenzene 5'-phosphate synthase